MIEILMKAIADFLMILPILIVAVIVSQVINHHHFKKNMKKKLRGEANIIKSTLIGVATPGPLLTYMPLLKSLKKKGVPIGVLAAFMTGQTLVGPMRIFLEVNYFGITFFIAKVAVSILVAVGVGTSFALLERKTGF